MKNTQQSDSLQLPQRWDKAIYWFKWYIKKYLPKYFHSLRISKACNPEDPANGPLIFILNHPSWWDPLVGIWLTELYPKREAFCPMDARGMEKYKFFSWLGFYGVELDSPRGAVNFLRKSMAILSMPNSMIWITAQGKFTDPRERPIRLRNGVGHLAARLQKGHAVPVAFEYCFWNERNPEILVRFGQPIALDQNDDLDADGWTKIFSLELQKTMDALSVEAQSRNPELFNCQFVSRSGVGGVYDIWRRFKSFLKGERFNPEHGFLDQEKEK